MTTREWHLVQRPQGHLTPDDLALVEAEVPDLKPGQILVRNTHLSVDPYMRGRMDDRPSYIPPFALNAPMEGAAIGVVAESRANGVEPGRLVEHFQGLREVSVLDAANARPIRTDGLPTEMYMGALGATGFTAWLGITEVAATRPGDTVFVTGAAGAVGGTAGQLARLRGAKRVIGSAGSPAKARSLVDDLGFDAAFDYHDGPLDEQLAKSAPDGIDVVFDNVGGVQLEAAIDHLRDGARLALCGMAGQYDGREPYGVRNLYELVKKRATARGFLVSDHEAQRPTFRAEVAPWVRSGELVHRETVLDGIDQVPEALMNLLSSGTPTMGKLVIRLP